jgi:preprotein translocase subunit Sec63
MVNRMIKYVEEFCKVDGYRCMMPIEYELIKEESRKKTYKKVKCNCHNVREKNATKAHHVNII